MKGLRIATSLLLAAFAAFIWLHDRAWLESASEVLPLLAVLPLAAWLGRPWAWRPRFQAPAPAGAALALALILAGAAADSLFVLALAWNTLAWLWLQGFVEPRAGRPTARLLALGMMAFPWLVLEGQGIGRFFRLSGAWAASGLFRLLGFEVERQGTRFCIEGLPISVDAACAGLNVLQAMLVIGTAFAAWNLRSDLRFALALLLLPPLAWLANTLRIVATGMVAITFGPEFAGGQLHLWGGWAVLCLMFALCMLALPRLEKPAAPPPEGGGP